MILTNVSNGANFCMKLPYFMKEISIFAPKPCILRNLRSKRERSGFSLLNLTVLVAELKVLIELNFFTPTHLNHAYLHQGT